MPQGIVRFFSGGEERAMEQVQAAPCRAGDVLLMHPFLVREGGGGRLMDTGAGGDNGIEHDKN
jgi:hypothetical protein